MGFADAGPVRSHEVHQDLVAGQIEFLHQLDLEPPGVAEVVVGPAEVGLQVGPPHRLGGKSGVAVAKGLLEFGGFRVFHVGIEGRIGAAPVDAGAHEEDMDGFALPQLLHGPGDVTVIFRDRAIRPDGPEGPRPPQKRGSEDPDARLGGIGEADFDPHGIVILGEGLFAGGEVAGDDEVFDPEFDVLPRFFRRDGLRSGDHQLPAGHLVERALVTEFEVLAGRPGAVGALDLQSLELALDGAGGALPAPEGQTHCVAVKQIRLGQGEKLVEALSREQLHAAGNREGRQILQVDMGVAVDPQGLRRVGVPEGDVVRDEALGLPVTMGDQGMEFEGGIDQQIAGIDDLGLLDRSSGGAEGEGNEKEKNKLLHKDPFQGYGLRHLYST